MGNEKRTVSNNKIIIYSSLIGPSDVINDAIANMGIVGRRKCDNSGLIEITIIDSL